MVDLQACERRVYRLATLLTGDTVAAAQVIEQVLDAQPKLTQLDSTHLDRLTVLRCRETGGSPIRHDLVPATLADTLAALPSQQREAWVFALIYRLAIRETARAMDCSVTATRRHLELAVVSVSAALKDEAVEAPQTLLTYSMSLDVPEFYRGQRRRRERQRRLLHALAAAGIILAVLGALAWLLGRG